MGEVWKVDVSTGKKHVIKKGLARQPSLSPRAIGLPTGLQTGANGISGRCPQAAVNRYLLPKIATSTGILPGRRMVTISTSQVTAAAAETFGECGSRRKPGRSWACRRESLQALRLGLSIQLISRDARSIAYAAVTILRNINKVHFDPEAESVVAEPVAVELKGGIHPSTSPDGQWLAFDDSFGKPESRNIGIIRTDGNDRRQVTRGRFRDFHPTWSPDGKRIAFHSTRSGNIEIWSVNSDGSGAKATLGRAFFVMYDSCVVSGWKEYRLL